MQTQQTSVDDTTLEEEASDARAAADIRAARVVDHAEVATWLATWGTPQEAPLPPSWRE